MTIPQPSDADRVLDLGDAYAACERATPGHWLPSPVDVVRGGELLGKVLCFQDGTCVIARGVRRADKHFIAAARQTLPAVLRLLAEARRELEGRNKAYALMESGMASQCDLMDAMKQEVRQLRAELTRLHAAFNSAVETYPQATPMPQAVREWWRMTRLQANALARLPFTESHVEDVYAAVVGEDCFHLSPAALRALLESHERLRAEAQGAEALLADAGAERDRLRAALADAHKLLDAERAETARLHAVVNDLPATY